MSQLFNSISELWYKTFGTGQAHSQTDASGYRDAQDDAIEEMRGTEATKAGLLNPSNNELTLDDYGAAGLSGLIQGVQATTFTANQRRLLEYQAQNYDNQVKTAALNAKVADNNMYNAYKVGAYRAMQQGLVDGQNIAAIRSASAQSGVRMNTGSKAEVEKSARLIKEQNRIANQMSTTSAAMNAHIAKANAQAQGIIAEGNAQAARTMQHGYSPLLSGLSTFSTAFAMSLLASRSK